MYNKIISVTKTHAYILLNSDETLKIPLSELNFKPKVKDNVEIYRSKEKIYVTKLKTSSKKWPYVFLSVIFITICCSLILFSALKKHGEENNITESKVSNRNSVRNKNSHSNKPSTASSKEDGTSISESSSLLNSSSQSSQQESSVSSTSSQTLGSSSQQSSSTGNFSGVVGTWENANGLRIVFDENGLVNGGTVISSGQQNGITSYNVSAGASGYAISFYPAGTSLPYVNSDINRDRIIAGQVAPSSENEVFYRIN